MGVIRVRCFHAGGGFTFCFRTNIYDEITVLERTGDLP
jgi:hypothetical protein